MGFDFFIEVRFGLCRETGKPYYYNENLTKNYDLSSMVVPEKYRRFLQMRGHLYYYYTQDVVNNETYHAYVGELLELFPSWEDITSKEDLEGYEWTETDHNDFKEALEWFTEQNQSYYASWSY